MEDFFRQRLTQLRIQRGISARDMSLSLGQSESYINKIENGKAFPSMQAFFYICEYFHITPKDFFDAENPNPVIFDELLNDMKVLTNNQLACIAYIIKEFKR